MNPLGKLMERAGVTRSEVSPKSKIGKVLHRGGVANTEELQRILALPFYKWQDDPELPALAAYLEGEYLLPPVKSCMRRCGHPALVEGCGECVRASMACVCRGEGTMGLRLVQAAALQEAHDLGGMFGVIRVGGGKTMISYLSGVVAGAERVLLVIPAKLRKKTLREFALLRRHWRGPKRMHIISYELLSRDRGAEELLAYRPDLVVSDESHKFKNPRAACTQRMHAYLTKINPEAAYLDMSGTSTKRSILEYHHRINWAIPDGLQPLMTRAIAEATRRSRELAS